MKIKKSISVLLALLLCVLIPSMALASTLAQPIDAINIEKSETITEQNSDSEIIIEETEQKGQEQIEMVEEAEEDITLDEKEQISEQPHSTETPGVATPPETPQNPEESAGSQPEEAVTPYNVSGYEVLEDGISAVVYTFAQLKEAIEQDNGILTVYLGADITIEKNRTTIPASKPSFTLSGRNPKTGERHTITEYSEPGLANIVLPTGNTGTKKVRLDDINIISRGSYYGLLGIEDGVRNVDYYVSDVTYTGRQFIYALYSHVYFEGKNIITINQTTNGQAGQEVAEIAGFTVTGSLNIITAAAFPVFKMDMGKSEINVSGLLNIQAKNISSSSGVFKSASDANALDINVLAGGNIYIIANNRLVSEAANTLNVGRNAIFHFEKTGGLRSDTHAAIRLRQKLLVDEGATFYLKQSRTGASYLIQFYVVPASLTGGVMEFNNPLLVTLINEGDRQMVYGQKAEEFDAVFEYMQYWSKGKQLADEPTHSFTMEDTQDGGRISINLTHKAGVVNSIVSNHSGITADVMKLDITPGIIIFGQIPEDETISTLIFFGQYELTGEFITDFEMENQVVERYAQTLITPVKIAGYIATGFSVNEGPLQRLSEGQAAVSPSVKEAYIVFYYSEPIIEVSMPTKLIFTAKKGDDGEIVSPEYVFVNNSNVNIEIVLTNVVEDESNRVSLANPQEVNTGQLALYINPKDKEQFAQIDLYAEMQEASIGTLQDRWQQSKKDFNFTLSGKYYGNYTDGAMWPKYQLEFAFRIV